MQPSRRNLLKLASAAALTAALPRSARASIELCGGDAAANSPDNIRIIALCYHGVAWTPHPQAITPGLLASQLDWMRKAGLNIISTQQIIDFVEGRVRLPQRAAHLTFDDGLLNTYTQAFPILQEHDAPFTLAINTGGIEGDDRAMTWRQVRELAESPLCELASHSHTHSHLVRFSGRNLTVELEGSRKMLEDRTGRAVDAFVYPFGEHAARLRRFVEEAGYRAAFEVRGGLIRRTSPRFALPRYGVTQETNALRVAYRLGVETSAQQRMRWIRDGSWS